MNRFGLIGKHIDYSFSRSYFTNKFEKEGLPCSYQNFDLATIEDFPKIIVNTKDLIGLHVTIPYKESISPYLKKLDEKAGHIGAVNTIKITKKGNLIGYNTDYYGFKKSITPLLKNHHKKALILGTGGASKAIIYTLKKLNISFSFVSRQMSENVNYTYKTLSEYDIGQHQIIINCTPLGTYPNLQECPDIPYNAITGDHLLFDLVYNPSLSTFLKKGQSRGATIQNGEKMLIFQAERAWKIWNK